MTDERLFYRDEDIDEMDAPALREIVRELAKQIDSEHRAHRHTLDVWDAFRQARAA